MVVGTAGRNEIMRQRKSMNAVVPFARYAENAWRSHLVIMCAAAHGHHRNVRQARLRSGTTSPRVTLAVDHPLVVFGLAALCARTGDARERSPLLRLVAMSRRGAKASDLVKLWIIEGIVVAAAIYSESTQSGAALCGSVGSNPQQVMLDCFTGSIARMLFPWAVGGAVLIGAMALALTVAYRIRRRG